MLHKNGDQSECVCIIEFEKDALEGWQSTGSTKISMKNLDKMAAKNFGASTFWTISITSIIAAAGIVSGILYFNNDTELTPTNQQKIIVERTDISLPESIDTLTELKKEIQLKSEEIIQKHKTEQTTTVQNTSDNVQFIEELEISLEPLPTNIEDKVVAISAQKHAKEIYLHGIKAIDYNSYRNNPEVKIDQIILNGVPANYENEVTNETEATTKTVLIGYRDYLDKTLSYVEKSKWKSALARWNEVLNDYPDDLNALFYSGFCLYNLKQYDEACAKFSACLQLNFSNFNEEATWYLAKSRLANGERSLAKELFKAIKENKGYYSKDAEKVLKDWK